MDISTTAAFNLSFRPPGSKMDGPVRYAIGRGADGHVLVGRSDKGICAIFLGDDVEELRRQLATAFPGVVLEEAAEALHDDLVQVIGFIDQRAGAAPIELDIGGTVFQQRVWQALCAIPPGQTRSYAEVAHGVGLPGAVRAVAGACAANVLAIAIPCHRVVRSDGSISGYRWGVERKRELLQREAQIMDSLPA